MSHCCAISKHVHIIYDVHQIVHCFNMVYSIQQLQTSARQLDISKNYNTTNATEKKTQKIGCKIRCK